MATANATPPPTKKSVGSHPAFFPCMPHSRSLDSRQMQATLSPRQRWRKEANYDVVAATVLLTVYLSVYVAVLAS